jgi:hypothetical protein
MSLTLLRIWWLLGMASEDLPVRLVAMVLIVTGGLRVLRTFSGRADESGKFSLAANKLGQGPVVPSHVDVHPPDARLA